MPNEKVNSKDLKPSERSPVIPEVSQAEKAQIAREREDKAKKKAERRAEKLEKEKAQREKAKAGGEHKEKPEKVKKEPEPEKPVFPAESKANRYGFIYLSGDILAAFGLKKGSEAKLTIDMDGDRLIITKA